MNNKALLSIVLIVVGIGLLAWAKRQMAPLKVGLVAELSGDMSAVGRSSKQGAELAIKQINDAGGVQTGVSKRKIELIERDNQSDIDTTIKVVNDLIDNDKVIAIIGPNASRFAIPAAKATETKRVLFISPWSTDPKTTLNDDGTAKYFAFRTAFTDKFQGQVLAKFAVDSLKAKKAALLFDDSTTVLKGQADFFKTAFEAAGGKIVSSQTYKPGDKDFSRQLVAIRAANPDVVFLPSYYTDAPVQIKQAHRLGLTAPFLGTDAWGNQQLLTDCGKECDGYYFGAHFAADNKTNRVVNFVDAYLKDNEATPDDVAALTYDSVGLIADAAGRTKKMTSEELRNAVVGLANHEGVTGDIHFPADAGDPVKSVMIMRIKDGAFHWSSEAKP